MKKIHYLILCCLVGLLASCDKDTDAVNFAPDVTTGGATDIFRKGATLSGKIQFAGESSAQDYGILVSEYPSMAEPTEYPITTGETDYKIRVQSLSPDRVYYYCAYANSGYSTARGDINSFQTTESNAPVFGEVVVDSIGSGSVRVTATIIDDGGVTPIISGFCWREGSSGVPTLIDNVVNVLDATGNTMTAVITGLTPLTDYVIAAYSVNSKGMGFSQGTSVQTEKGPGIYSLEDLVAFRDARNAGEDVSRWKTSDGIINVFADIDLSPIENWEPISQILDDEVFEGNNHTISNLNISFKATETFGFYYIGFISINEGSISGLHFKEGIIEISSIPDGDRIWCGTVCGRNFHSIVNCSSNVNILSSQGDNFCGGICGYNHSYISTSTNRGLIKFLSKGYTGCGIAGDMGPVYETDRPLVENCENYGTISADSCYYASGITWAFGGIKHTKITNCNNYGNVYASSAAGIGEAFEISNCINYGDVEGIIGSISGTVGGITPLLIDNWILQKCSNKGNISGGHTCGGIVGRITSNFVGIYNGNINEGIVRGEAAHIGNNIGIDERGSN